MFHGFAKQKDPSAKSRRECDIMASKNKGTIDLSSVLALFVTAEERLAAIVKEAPERAVTFRDHADAIEMPTRSVVDRVTQGLGEDDLRVVRSVGHLFDGRFTHARVALEAVCLMRRTAEAALNGEEVRATEQTEWLEVTGDIRHPDMLVRLGTAFGRARDGRYGNYVVLTAALKPLLPTPEVMLAFCETIPARLPWKQDVERYVGDLYTGSPVNAGSFRWATQRLVAHVCWLEDENTRRFAANLRQAEATHGPKLLELRKQAERLGIQVTEVRGENLRTVRDWEAAVEARQAEVNEGKAARPKAQASSPSPQPKPAPVAPPKVVTLAERLLGNAATPAKTVQAAAATVAPAPKKVAAPQSETEKLRSRLEAALTSKNYRERANGESLIAGARNRFDTATDDAERTKVVEACEGFADPKLAERRTAERIRAARQVEERMKSATKTPLKGLASLAEISLPTTSAAPSDSATIN